MAASIEIRTAETDEERQRIYRFRYEVYVDEMGKKPRQADHTAKTITDDLDEAALLLSAEADGQIVGTVRLNYRGREPFPESWERLYRIPAFAADYGDQISMTSRLMVAKDWRGSSVSGLLVNAVYNAGREMGSRFDFCNCAASLIEFYEQIGFRRFAPGFLDEDNGYRVPLVMVVRDLEHLKTVRSPLYRVVRHLEHEPETGDWFRATFPAYAATGHARSLGPEEFWARLSEHLSESPAACVPLFEGMSDEEASTFLRSGTVLTLHPGDKIIRQGDVGDEMEVILAGAAEATSRNGQQTYSLTVMGKG